MNLILFAIIFFHIQQTQSSNFHQKHILSPSYEFINELSHSYLHSSKKDIFDSPQCWIGSLEEILVTNNIQNVPNDNFDNNSHIHKHLSGNSICSSMSKTDRMILALQLTKCFFTESYLNFPPQCDSQMHTNDHIKNCTQALNSAELNSYNEFYNQIYHICSKLSQELWNQKLMDSTYFLFQSSQTFSNNLDKIVSQHRLDWEHFNEKHRLEQESYFNQMNQKLKASFHEMEQLNHIYDKIIHFFSYGKHHMAIFHSFLLFLFEIIGFYFLTSFSRAYRARFYIIFIQISGLLLEIGFHSYSIFIIFLSSQNIIPSIRKGSFILQVTVLLYYFCLGKEKNKKSKNHIQSINDNMVQQIESSFKSLRNESLKREERMMEVFHESFSTITSRQIQYQKQYEQLELSITKQLQLLEYHLPYHYDSINNEKMIPSHVNENKNPIRKKKKKDALIRVFSNDPFMSQSHLHYSSPRYSELRYPIMNQYIDDQSQLPSLNHEKDGIATFVDTASPDGSVISEEHSVAPSNNCKKTKKRSIDEMGNHEHKSQEKCTKKKK